MTEYTIVEPGFEFIEPPGPDNYLEFLETCTRVCYKSEDRIKPGSAEKLMKKVVGEYEHYSVTEHARWIVRLNLNIGAETTAAQIMHNNPLMAISYDDQGMIVSGNLRMWMDLFNAGGAAMLTTQLRQKFAKRFPLFNLKFDPNPDTLPDLVEELDSNPIANNNGLSVTNIKKHMTLTCKIIGDRSMSHQLVRHRMGAYSQESQRYCNYGKKGFQFIVPPSATNGGPRGYPTARQRFINCALQAYESYEEALDYGLKPEDARGLLPNCTKTEVVCTYTLDMWKHLFDHRGHNPKAQWQIREIMLKIEHKFHKLLPEIF